MRTFNGALTIIAILGFAPIWSVTGMAKAGATDDNVEVADPLEDVQEVPARDLRVGGDDKQRYFLIGKVEPVDSPAEASGLVVVLPGGDGSADFHPFIRRISQNVLPKGWLIAQAVAPLWDKKQPEQVVWPTEKLPYPAAKFTTEDFIEAIIADVRAKAKVDSRRIFLLGWSSGGPPCYAAALRKETPVTGAFIAMSVFREQLVPAIENSKGRAFYLLQSPDDRVTPFRFAVDAEKTLHAAGARVRLQRYDGGHGWQGNVWQMIGDGIQWLEGPVTGATVANSSPPTPADKTASNILLNPSMEDGEKSPAEWSQGADLEGVEYLWDKKSATPKGQASLCLKKTAKRYFPVAQWFQVVVRKTDRPSLRVSAQVKAERVTKAVIDVIFLDEKGEQISHEWAAYIGAKEASDSPADHDWKEYLGKVKIPERTKKLQIGLQIYGPGKVWFDEARAEYVE